MDRKPKPTRQQDRESLSWLSDVKTPSQAAPVPDPVSVLQEMFERAASEAGRLNSRPGLVQATRPAYLRPGHGVPLDQRPPPMSSVA